MKFIVSSTLLLKNLQAILGVINTSNTLPILDNFLFELKEEGLTITSSDLETTMSVTLTPDKAVETGSIAIPAKILVETLKTFADIPVSFTINEALAKILDDKTKQAVLEAFSKQMFYGKAQEK